MHQQPPPVHLPAHRSSCVVHQHLSKHSYPLSYPSDASNGYHKDTSAVPLRLIRPSHPNSAASRGPSLSWGRAGPRRGPRARLTFTFNTSPSLVKPSRAMHRFVPATVTYVCRPAAARPRRLHICNGHSQALVVPAIARRLPPIACICDPALNNHASRLFTAECHKDDAGCSSRCRRIVPATVTSVCRPHCCPPQGGKESLFGLK